ncbi:MAG: hypothetical protein U0936_01765 [Planctomycetaceae bacterium]
MPYLSTRYISTLIWLCLFAGTQSGFSQDQFPSTPYSGMQLTYGITGASIDDSNDLQDVTRTRILKGRTSGDTLRIQGEFSSRNPENSRLSVVLWVDDERKELRLPDAAVGGSLQSPQRFELTINVPPNAKRSGINVIAGSSTALGARELQIKAEFQVPQPTPSEPLSEVKAAPVVAAQIVSQQTIDVRMRSDDQAEWSPVDAEAKILVGTRLQTGSDHPVVLQLANQDEVCLDKGSEVLLLESGVLLRHGRCKFKCSDEQSPRLLLTEEFITQFSGHHLAIEYHDSRTTVINIDGVVQVTSRTGHGNGLKIQAGIRAEGDANGFDRFELVEMTDENQQWQQLGLGGIIPPQTESIAEVKDATTETSEVVMEPASNPVTPSATASKTPASIELPADPDIAIIVLDSVGGYTPPRKSKEPELVIYANGRAVITDPFGKHPQVIRHLTPENLKAFLEFVVNEHHYYDLTTESLGALIEQMKAQGAVPEITDMPTAIVRIGIRNMTYEVRCPSPDYFATQFPEIDPFRHYGAIYKRLTTFITASREWSEKQKK